MFNPHADDRVVDRRSGYVLHDRTFPVRQTASRGEQLVPPAASLRTGCRGTALRYKEALERYASFTVRRHPVRYRLLGNSGLRVSEAALGTMTFGDDWGWGSAKDEARKVYDAFREAGGNFIDTANMYTNGTSESFLGEFMEGHRQSVVLATKYTNAVPGKDPNAGGNQRKNMVQAVEASLKRLQTDYIDLYWVHIWDQITPVEEVMRGWTIWFGRQGALCRHLRCAGLVDRAGEHAGRSAGLVALRRTADRIQPDRANGRAGADPDGQGAEPRRDGLVAAGRRRADRQVPRPGVVRRSAAQRANMLKNFMPGRTDRPHRGRREDCGRGLGRSMAQVALAWLRHRPVPVIPIIGARKLSQLQDNLASFDLSSRTTVEDA